MRLEKEDINRDEPDEPDKEKEKTSCSFFLSLLHFFILV
jgi:hypothetical protein